MAIELTLSCDSDKTETGPTLIHSIGVENYKIPPEMIRILQENLTNDFLSDNEQGVLCQADPQRILDILRQHGFYLQNQTTEEEKNLWIVVKDGEGSGNDNGKPDEPNPATNDDNEGQADGEEQGGGGEDEGENKEGEEEEEQG